VERDYFNTYTRFLIIKPNQVLSSYIIMFLVGRIPTKHLRRIPSIPFYLMFAFALNNIERKCDNCTKFSIIRFGTKSPRLIRHSRCAHKAISKDTLFTQQPLLQKQFREFLELQQLDGHDYISEIVLFQVHLRCHWPIA